MKKVIISAITLILFILLFTAIPIGNATSRWVDGLENDPIVGCWYIDMELNGEIEIPDYEGYTRFVMVLTFEADGKITRFEIDYKSTSPEIAGPATVGKWVKTDKDEYKLSIIALGTETAYIINDDLLAIAATKDVYYRFHKMQIFDWYEDMYAK